MSPLSFFARHPRGDLSAYIDEQLSPSRRLTVESHLERCDSCRTEIAALNEARAVLASLPQASAPRSFALTPQQVAGPARQRPPERVAPAFFGMRLASGFAAASLAVLLVLDVGGGTSNDSGGDDSAPAMELAASALDQDRASSGDAAPEAGDDAAATSAPTDSSLQVLGTPTPAGAGGGTSGGGVGGSAPTPPAGDVPSPNADDGTDRDDTVTVTPTFEYGGDMTTEAPVVGALPSTTDDGAYDSTGEQMGLTNADTLANKGLTDDNSDGLSALQIAEIVLAATFAVAVAGGFFLPLALRRNR